MRVVRISNDVLEGPLVAQIMIPWRDARHEDGAPAAVMVHGAWRTDGVPLNEEHGHLLPGYGMVLIYLNLPGGTGEYGTPGEEDRRGPISRAAVGVALRYAAGELQDEDGCSLADRMVVDLAPRRVIAGYSNGGNLAWATLADEDVDLPEVVGIATFETPTSGQFATVEPGTGGEPSPVYREQSCALDEELGIACEYTYDGLAYDMDGASETSGVLYIDEDEDDSYTKTDFPLGQVWSPSDELWMHSSQATWAAEAASIELPLRGDGLQAETFWSTREAPRSARALAERWPRIAVIAAGSEEDHILSGMSGHAHVTGLISAAQAAGMAWSRVQPDACYAELVANEELDFADNPADLEVTVHDDQVSMEPDQDYSSEGSQYLTAAVLELVDRAWADDWSPDLESTLVAPP